MEIVDDGVVQQDIEPCPDQKITDRRLVYGTLAVDIIDGRNTGMYYVIPARKEKTFVDMGEEVECFFHQGSCIQSMSDCFLPAIGAIITFKDLLTIKARDGHDAGQWFCF